MVARQSDVSAQSKPTSAAAEAGRGTSAGDDGAEAAATTTTVTGEQDEAYQPPPPKKVVYCQICSFPPEYCEFSAASSAKCRAWLESAQPDLHRRLYSAEAVAEAMSGLTAQQREQADKEAAKRERKAKAKEEKAEKEMKTSKIVLKRESRTRKKAITIVYGLHLFSPPLPALKVIAKGLSSKLATGASVSKCAHNPQLEEIVVQGDVADDVRAMVVGRQKPFDALPTPEQGGPAEGNVVVEEEKKKRPPASATTEAGGGAAG